MLYIIENRKHVLSSEYIENGLSPIPHLHTHLELIYLTAGSSIATVDYMDHPVEKGDLFLAFPNQIHFYHDIHPCSGKLLIFSHDLWKELKDTFQNKVPSHPVIRRDRLPADTEALLEKIMAQNNGGQPYGRLAARGLLLALLCELLPLMTLIPSPNSYDSIKNILIYCSGHYTEPLSLDILSRELHLNKYYISHLFKDRMKISFPDFINGMRVEHACNLLQQNPDITEAAFASGFSSVRTFNRAFSKFMETTPREYIKDGQT